jgi:DNA-binding NtrC family response regulator
VNKSVEPLQVTALAVSPHDADHQVLGRLFAHSNWLLKKARSLDEAKRILTDCPASVILCEETLPDGSWLDVLSSVSDVENPPRVIVTSRLADSRLWGEVLNLGGFDVLEKPFVPSELYRVVAEAWRRWMYSSEDRAVPAGFR